MHSSTFEMFDPLFDSTLSVAHGQRMVIWQTHSLANHCYAFKVTYCRIYHQWSLLFLGDSVECDQVSSDAKTRIGLAWCQLHAFGTGQFIGNKRWCLPRKMCRNSSVRSSHARNVLLDEIHPEGGVIRLLKKSFRWGPLGRRNLVTCVCVCVCAANSML